MTNTALENHLVQGVLYDAGGVGGFEARDNVTGYVFFDNGVDGDPLRVAELGDGGRVERGEHGEHSFKVGALDVEHEADLRLRVDGAAQHERDLIDLVLLPLV